MLPGRPGVSAAARPTGIEGWQTTSEQQRRQRVIGHVSKPPAASRERRGAFGLPRRPVSARARVGGGAAHTPPASMCCCGSPASITRPTNPPRAY